MSVFVRTGPEFGEVGVKFEVELIGVEVGGVPLPKGAICVVEDSLLVIGRCGFEVGGACCRGASSLLFVARCNNPVRGFSGALRGALLSCGTFGGGCRTGASPYDFTSCTRMSVKVTFPRLAKILRCSPGSPTAQHCWMRWKLVAATPRRRGSYCVEHCWRLCRCEQRKVYLCRMSSSIRPVGNHHQKSPSDSSEISRPYLFWSFGYLPC